MRKQIKKYERKKMSSPLPQQSRLHFLRPSFNKKIQGRVHKSIALPDPNTLVVEEHTAMLRPAIATSGFRADEDGTYIFAAVVPPYTRFAVGFTDTSEIMTSSNQESCPGNGGMPGVSLEGPSGRRHPASAAYFENAFMRTVSEIVSILTISENGAKKTVQWIAGGREGPVIDCSTNFQGDDIIFPCICLGNDGKQAQTVPIAQLTLMSPLMQQVFLPVFTALKSRLGGFFEKHAPYNLPKLNEIVSGLMLSAKIMDEYFNVQMRKMYQDEA